MEKYIVTITREFGSLGRPIAMKMSEALGIEFYDRDIVDQSAQELDLPASLVTEKEESAKGTRLNNPFFRMAYPLGHDKASHTQDKIFNAQEKIIKFLVKKESCIVVGRCSDFILSEEENIMHIFIYAPYSQRVKNSIETLGLSEQEARRMIHEADRAREEYHIRYAGFKPDDKKFKDIMIDSSLLGPDGTANLLVDAVKQKFHLS